MSSQRAVTCPRSVLSHGRAECFLIVETQAEAEGEQRKLREVQNTIAEVPSRKPKRQ